MSYNKEELEKAFNKELFLIKNDLYYQQYELVRNGDVSYLRVDISYQPYDILSGDTYSLRKTKDGRLVGFIADAMGKGISAAMSGMAITRFLNYFFDDLEEEGDFKFQVWISKMLRFVQRNLHDEEIMCIALVEFDIKHGLLHYASCGMPALLIQMQNDEIHSIKSNNPPLGCYTDNVDIKSLVSTQMKKMLCYTDGLSESFTHDNEPYAFKLTEDFVQANCSTDFRQRVKRTLGKGDDDLTYVYIEKVNRSTSFKTLFIPSTYEAVDDALACISEYFKENAMGVKCLSELVLTFSELLLNALEHGSFGVDKARKNYLIEHDAFDEEMVQLERVHQDKIIRVEYGILQSGEHQLFEAVICDEGDGFDTKILKDLVINPQSVNGRGFMIIKKLLDHFYFNEKGNSITIQKFVS